MATTDQAGIEDLKKKQEAQKTASEALGKPVELSLDGSGGVPQVKGATDDRTATQRTLDTKPVVVPDPATNKATTDLAPLPTQGGHIPTKAEITGLGVTKRQLEDGATAGLVDQKMTQTLAVNKENSEKRKNQVFINGAWRDKTADQLAAESQGISEKEYGENKANAIRAQHAKSQGDRLAKGQAIAKSLNLGNSQEMKVAREKAKLDKEDARLNAIAQANPNAALNAANAGNKAFDTPNRRAVIEAALGGKDNMGSNFEVVVADRVDKGFNGDKETNIERKAGDIIERRGASVITHSPGSAGYVSAQQRMQGQENDTRVAKEDSYSKTPQAQTSAFLQIARGGGTASSEPPASKPPASKPPASEPPASEPPASKPPPDRIFTNSTTMSKWQPLTVVSPNELLKQQNPVLASNVAALRAGLTSRPVAMPSAPRRGEELNKNKTTKGVSYLGNPDNNTL